MNKYQQALNNCINRWAPAKDWNLLKELVEKATPKKPKEQLIDNYCKGIPGDPPNENEPYYFCPSCNEWVGDDGFKYKYCQNCGQALDWSEE